MQFFTFLRIDVYTPLFYTNDQIFYLDYLLTLGLSCKNTACYLYFLFFILLFEEEPKVLIASGKTKETLTMSHSENLNLEIPVYFECTLIISCFIRMISAILIFKDIKTIRKELNSSLKYDSLPTKLFACASHRQISHHRISRLNRS